MPYIREGKCVYKKNPDGSKGESKGCSETEEMAKKHMAALYAAENKSLAEFSMRITKATIPEGGKKDRTMRLSMVTSDTGEDAYEERMSVDLYNDFVERINSNAPVPAPFDVICEEGWHGGMPYQSISHFRSGNGKNVPGPVERVYVDGELLKANAILEESPIGLAVWKAVCQDMEDRQKPIEERAYPNPVRISIGFLDLEHKHVLDDGSEFVFTRSDLKHKCEKCEEEIGGKVYLKGQLVHLAYTRVPANPRTSVEVLRMSDEILTKSDDAKSIIGDLADELVDKSLAKEDVLVVKAKDEGRDQEEMEEDDDEMKEEKSETLPEPTATEEVMEPDVQVAEKAPVVKEESKVIEPVVEQKSALDLAIEKFKAQVLANKGKGSAALNDIQPFFDELGNVVKSEVTNPMEEQATITRTAVREEVAAAMQAVVPEIVAQIMKSLPNAQVVQPTAQAVPQPRSLLIDRSVPAQKPARELTTIEKIAYNNSVGYVTGQRVE